MKRRHAIRAALGSLIAPLLGRKAMGEHSSNRDIITVTGPEPDPGISPEPITFGFGGHHLRVDPVDRSVVIVDRRELFGHLDQPVPTRTIKVSERPDDRLIVLVWDADPSGSCARCPNRCGVSLTSHGDWRCVPEDSID